MLKGGTLLLHSVSSDKTEAYEMRINNHQGLNEQEWHWRINDGCGTKIVSSFFYSFAKHSEGIYHFALRNSKSGGGDRGKTQCN